MKNFGLQLLKSFHYETWSDLGQSLIPTTKYNLTVFTAVSSALLVPGDQFIKLVFGLDGLAFIALLAVLLAELVSGIMASQFRKEKFESSKLRRFGFRLFYYLVIIGVSYLLCQSFQARDKGIGAEALDWLHSFIVLQIVFENTISILENISVIDGKDKTHIIQKLRDKINSILS